MKKLVLVFFMIGSWALAGAQEKLTMQECIQIALGNNLTVKRSVYNVETNRISLLTSKGNFLPSLNLNTSGSQNYGRNLNPVTYQYYEGVTKTINPAVMGQITLFNGLRNQYTFRQSKKNIEAADLDLQKAKNDVIISVVTNYTNVILNKELLENAKFQLNSGQQTLDKITKQVEAGALSLSNQLSQEAVVATNESNLVTQENAYNLSLLTLKQSMQVPASNQFEIVVPDITIEDMSIPQTPEEVYKTSTENLPQVKSALLKVESAELALKAARANYLPKLSGSFAAISNYNSASDGPRYNMGGMAPVTIGYVNGNTSVPVTTLMPQQIQFSDHYRPGEQLADNMYKNLGLSLSIPILSGFQTRTGVQQAIINRELANITVKETENTLRQAIETAYNNAIAAAKTYAAAVKQVKSNQEAFRMTQQRYENGAATYIEYQVSSNDLFSAKSSLARAKYNFLLTKKVLEFYQGKTIEY
ncbi:MAG: TolC family protein [Bacteroidetes bacterium]|nr:TolC family protein [Bacteroidota bacterium]MBS1539189.1 TolC family protein [Bacteroidota bacterium]